MIKEVSVLLEQGTSSGSLSGTGIKFTDPDGKEAVLSGTVTIQKRGNREISAGNKIFRTPLKAVSDSPMKYNGRAYRGCFVFKNKFVNGLKVSNLVDLEQYLRGVIKAREIDQSGIRKRSRLNVSLQGPSQYVQEANMEKMTSVTDITVRVYKGMSR